MSRTSRRWLIIVSLSAHAALAVGIFVTGVWKIERLDYRHRVSLTVGAMLPPGEAGGGDGDRAPEKKQEPKRDKPKKVAKDPHQVAPKVAEAPAALAASVGEGDGEGDGDGDQVGPGTGGGGGGECDPLTDAFQCKGAPAAAVCGNGVVDTREECDDGNTTSGDRCSATCMTEQDKPIIVPPTVMTGLRIAGETQIVPPDPVKTAMLRDGKERTVGTFKLCVDSRGYVSSIGAIGPGTTYAAYDSKIIGAMRSWRYRPYSVDGRPVPVCSVVTFVYTIK